MSKFKNLYVSSLRYRIVFKKIRINKSAVKIIVLQL